MQMNRQMVKLFFKIKQHLPARKRRNFKISTPNIIELITKVQETTEKETVRLLCGTFLEHADSANTDEPRVHQTRRSNLFEHELISREKTAAD